VCVFHRIKAGVMDSLSFCLGCERVFSVDNCNIEKLMHFLLRDSETYEREIVDEKKNLKKLKSE